MQLKMLLIAVACMFLAGCEESKDWGKRWLSGWLRGDY
jgi:hypothetical protein